MAKDAKGLALITGASAGIGELLARLFAADGHDVILVARRRERLETLAQSLQSEYDVTAHVLAMDLGDPEAHLKIEAALNENQWTVDYLVNNAGLGQYGAFAQSDVNQLMVMMHVNMTALVGLTRVLLPGMLERGRGRILNVGSLAGFQPGPGMSVYYATKAFVYSFTEGLVGELSGTPVSATNLAPGAVHTEFADAAQMTESWLFAMGAASAQVVAEAGYRGMMKGKPLVIPGIRNNVFAFSSRLTPRAVVRSVAGKMNSDKG